MASTYIKDKEIIDNEISPFLDEFFYNKSFHPKGKVNFTRVTDRVLQNKGIDGYLKNNIAADEKIATHYVNSSLNTFAFEINYLKDNNILDGWLFGDKYSETIYYILGYLKCKDIMEKDWTNIKKDNIEQIDLIFVKKESIHNFLLEFDITKENYHEKSQKLRNHLKNTNSRDKQVNIKVNGTTKSIRWYLSPGNHYYENPLNILIQKADLCDLAKYCFEVTRDQIKMVDKIK
ncbi:hypothetical protein HO906_05355 [Streptococcus suis]|nr:hypothetical protein [Streptococcus suis]NQP67058.1 hypothetical protein [Streptococcus suis]HEM5494890.1 hypothetical protein [Streptococcus suis]